MGAFEIVLFCKSIVFMFITLFRKFGVKCDGCLLSLDRNDLVMKTKAKVFHTECFRCTICSSKLQQGDQFVLQGEGEILCRAHFIDHEAAIQEKPIFNDKSEALIESGMNLILYVTAML